MKVNLKNISRLSRLLLSLLIIVSIGFAGTTVYLASQITVSNSDLTACHNALNQEYSKEAKLGAEIVNLQNQISVLNANISSLEGLKAPNVLLALGCTEILSNSTYNANNPQSFDHLWITGTVTNEGLSTAYNAGINVVAYDVNGNMILNITVPVAYGTYGNGENNLTPLTTIAPLQQVDLQGTGVGIAIYHEGLANTWNLKAVWTDSP